MDNGYPAARTLVLAAAGLLLAVYAYLMQDYPRPAAPVPTPTPVPTPDFAAFTDVKAKKKAFFNWLKPQVAALNDELLIKRTQLLDLRAKFDNQNNLNQTDLDWLSRLAAEFGVTLSDPPLATELTRLLRRVDTVPASLVLTQAAIESGWGTSRFARKANNYFGLWCFTPGCGLAPSRRVPGKSHEVQRFDSPIDSVRTYLHTLNTHPAYQTLRQLRAQLRAAERPLHGCVLAAGLESYSERGMAYVDEVRHFIRYNRLSPHGSAPCQQTTATTD